MVLSDAAVDHIQGEWLADRVSSEAIVAHKTAIAKKDS
jgi:hypothetical protein